MEEQNIIQEIWRPVAETKYSQLYEISNLGRVKSLAKFIENSGNFSGGYHKKLHYKASYVDHDGYRIIKLCINGQCLNRKIHRMVAEAFIPNPLNLPQVNHIDGNKQNNAVSNLEWCTRSANIQHAFATGLMTNEHLRGTKNHSAKVDEATVRDIRHQYDHGLLRYSEILKAYPQVSAGMLKDIINHKTWKNI